MGTFFKTVAVGSLAATFVLLMLAVGFEGTAETAGSQMSALQDKASGLAMLGLVAAGICLLSCVLAMAADNDSPARSTNPAPI